MIQKVRVFVKSQHKKGEAVRAFNEWLKMRGLEVPLGQCLGDMADHESICSVDESFNDSYKACNI